MCQLDLYSFNFFQHFWGYVYIFPLKYLGIPAFYPIYKLQTLYNEQCAKQSYSF